MKRLFKTLLLLGCGTGLWACQDQNLPTAEPNDVLRDQLRGTWVPVSLTMNYQIGTPPRQRDTTITLTPTTAPLLVPNRANPIMPFTDTLTFGTRTAAQLDTFFLANRGIRQRGYFFVATSSEGPSLLRIGVPTRAAGQITRWNYDVVLHGSVVPSASNAPTYAVSTYANYPFTIRELSGDRLVLSLLTPANVGNVPLVPITAANQGVAVNWAGRVVLLRATFQRR